MKDSPSTQSEWLVPTKLSPRSDERRKRKLCRIFSDGSTLSYEYDNLDRMTRKTVPERAGLAAAHTRDVFYAYDLRGLPTQARFDSLAGEGVENVYDAFGRLVESRFTMGGVTRTLGHQYDAAGRRTRLTYPGGQSMTYGYDAASRLTGLYEGAGTSTPLATWSYNVRGLPTARSEGAGSGASWTWDPVERMASLGHAFTSGNGAATTSFTYHPLSPKKCHCYWLSSKKGLEQEPLEFTMLAVAGPWASDDHCMCPEWNRDSRRRDRFKSDVIFGADGIEARPKTCWKTRNRFGGLELS